MSTEREHGRATQIAQVQLDRDASTPGRASASSQLDAPTNPLSSALVQRKAERDDNGVAANADQAIATASASAGMSLPATIQRKFEASLGTDLSSVRVHTGTESQSAAHAVGAKAYTMGQDIHFGAGHYDPSSAAGEHLLAHEVAHTVQQRGGTPTRQNKLEVSSPADAAEHEADRAADAMVGGRQASITGSAGVHRQVFRDAGHAGGGGLTANLKGSFDIGELKFPDKEFTYVKIAQSLKAKGTLELVKGGDSADITGGPTVGAVGGKGDVTVAEQHYKRALGGMQLDSTKEKMSFELTREQLKAQAGVEIRGHWADIDWLKAAGDVNFIFAGVKWKDVEKDPSNVKVAAVEGAVGASGEGTGRISELGGREAKANITAQYVVSASPNWANIGLQAAKEIAKEGATTAGTETATATTAGTATAEVGTGTAATEAALADSAIVIDSGAVASAAATIIFPLGAAALIVAGFVQSDKNLSASRAAIAMGLKLRHEASAYVDAYIATIFGDHAASGRGAIDANVKVAEYMARSKKNRVDACADLAKMNDRAKLRADTLSKFRDAVYEKGCLEFDSKFASQFGYLEIYGGPTWGMRAVFRKDFYRILYSDE